MRVAFLGLGIMGAPMAANLARSGHQVTVWNRTPGKQVEGTTPAATPAEAAAGAEVVWVCVSDTAAVEQVLFGENGVENSLAEGMIVVDSSTISPAATVAFAERVRRRGAGYVDAPVTGSKLGAESAQLLFIVGGDEAIIARIESLFRAMGRGFHRMGDNGKGQAAKLAMNLQIALIYQGFAEGLTLAGKLGVPAEKLVALVNDSMVRSGVVEYKAPFVLRRDFSPNFPLRLMLKDLNLILEAAHEARIKLPGAETVQEIYDLAAEEDHHDQDYAATLLLLEKWASYQVKGTSA